LIVTTDVRAGRFIKGVQEIMVGRVDIPMIAYDDKKKNIIRPPTTSLSIIDHRTGKTKEFKHEDLASLPQLNLRNALMAGDCEGFNGVYGYEGPSLRSVLEWFGLSWADRDYARYVVVSSEDGFCATFSVGELFNSRLDNNIIIAHKKNGAFLEPKGGFATSVVGEDSMGGRSVKRIYRIEIF
jgi:DMSO/TMAO reductase YedYZ molybdopterin-dependent catalytic subunit